MANVILPLWSLLRQRVFDFNNDEFVLEKWEWKTYEARRKKRTTEWVKHSQHLSVFVSAGPTHVHSTHTRKLLLPSGELNSTAHKCAACTNRSSVWERERERQSTENLTTDVHSIHTHTRLKNGPSFFLMKAD